MSEDNDEMIEAEPSDNHIQPLVVKVVKEKEEVIEDDPDYFDHNISKKEIKEFEDEV